MHHGSNLTENPADHLDDQVCWLHSLQQVHVALYYQSTKLIVLIVVLDNQLQIVVQDAHADVLATELKQNVHCVDIPLVRWGKPLSQLADFSNEVLSKVWVCRAVQSGQHLLRDHFDVSIVGHFEE